MKNLVKRFKSGDSVSDHELDLLISHYINLCDLLDLHGEIFHLTWRECYDRLLTLNAFKEARK